jgi:hypothetical protein
MKNAFYLAMPVLFWLTAPTLAYDAFSEQRSPSQFVLTGTEETRLVLKGRLHLAWHDLEGDGGPRHDSISDTATLGTRSPHFALESARVAFRVELPTDLSVYTALAFSETGGASRERLAGFPTARWSLAYPFGARIECTVHRR